MDRVFWNICAEQSGGVHDGGQFLWSSLYAKLWTREILWKPLIQLGGQEVKPYLLEDSTYSIRSNLLKNFKPDNLIFRYKIWFDSTMNPDRVVIEIAFAALKNRWRILKAFNMAVDKCAMGTLACCVLHNFCKFHKERIPLPRDVRM